MFAFFIKKYWIGLTVATAFIILGYQTEGNFNDGMFMAVALGILTYFATLIISAKRGNMRTAITMLHGTMSLFKTIWDIITLKPLRRWAIRKAVVGFSPAPYPFLPMYGSITDAQAMMKNYTSSLWFDNSPAARAAIWRLFSRGVLRFDTDSQGVATIKMGEWVAPPSDGVDQALEMTIYKLMKESSTNDGMVSANTLYNDIKNMGKKKGKSSISLNSLYRFADLLSTSISKKDYSRQETSNLYGMKKFLKNLPSSFQGLTGEARKLDLQRIWSEYVAFAYLFGMGKKTIHHLSTMMPESKQPPLLNLLCTSSMHQALLDDLMKKASESTYYADDIVSANRGRLKIAWHADEVYDITPT